MGEIQQLKPVRYLDEKVLLEQKQKLINDKQKVLTRLQEIEEERDKLIATKHAIDGALQTCDYFSVTIDSVWNKKQTAAN